MDMFGDYVFKREVDISLLSVGFSIPLKFQVVFKRNIGKFLEKGETKDIILLLGGKPFKAQIINQNFNVTKYSNHKDIIQIRYNKNNDIVEELKKIFFSSYKYINEQRIKRKLSNDYNGGKVYINIPYAIKEYLIIYTTEYEDTYMLDTITASDIYEIEKYTKNQSEEAYEESFNYDITDTKAAIVLDERIVKIRKYNSSIGKNLKKLYDYKCQICGKRIGEVYGSNVVEAHHIESFVKSINNDMNNILIVCPNHHSIIHDVNPNFDRKKKIYIYKNNYAEGLNINYHL